MPFMLHASPAYSSIAATLKCMCLYLHLNLALPKISVRFTEYATVYARGDSLIWKYNTGLAIGAI